MVDGTTAIYVRDTLATEPDEQIELALDYATNVLGVDPTEVVVLSDTALRGRDAQSSSDQKLFDLATAGELDHVIVRDALRIATNIQDLHDRVQRFIENEIAVHIIEPGLRINDSGGSPDEEVDDHAMLRAIGIAAELEASVSSERTREDIAEAQAEGKHVGRPPFGFDSDADGNLVPNDDFETALAVIKEIETLKTRGIEAGNVRFEESGAREYLQHLKETGIADQLHHEDLMNRERLVAFADAGYTAVDDLLGTADPIDISQDTGVDRDIVSSIATNYLDGFSSGSTFGDTGPLEELAPKDSFTGWELVEASSNRIRWVAGGRFNLTISPAPEGSTTIACNAPEAERNAWYRKGRSVEAGLDESLAPEEALARAHEWLEAHQLEYEDDLAQLPQIGAATKDYLALDYGITSREALRVFAEDQPDEFDDIFGFPRNGLREALER